MDFREPYCKHGLFAAVMVALDEDFASGEHVADAPGDVRGRAREIPSEDDLILWPDCLFPLLYHVLVHLAGVPERSVLEADNLVMAEMGVRDEVAHILLGFRAYFNVFSFSFRSAVSRSYGTQELAR